MRRQPKVSRYDRISFTRDTSDDVDMEAVIEGGSILELTFKGDDGTKQYLDRDDVDALMTILRRSRKLM